MVALLADFLTEITPDSDGEEVADGYAACQLLWHLGPRASTAIPALEHCLGLDGREYDLIRWLRLMAAEAKWRITGDSTAALAVATELLADPEWWLVAHAADLLGEVGITAWLVVADLERLFSHENESTRKHVHAAIRRVLSSALELET